MLTLVKLFSRHNDYVGFSHMQRDINKWLINTNDYINYKVIKTRLYNDSKYLYYEITFTTEETNIDKLKELLETDG